MKTSFWSGKNVAVTGAAGFIGRRLVETLVQNGAFVRAVGSKKISPDLFSPEIRKNIECVTADCSNLSDTVSALKDEEAVFHLAGLDGGYIFKRDHETDIFSTNTRLALNVLEASKVNGVSRLLLMSSVEVYPQKKIGLISESYGNDNWFFEPVSGYAWAKRIGEIAAKFYQSETLGIALVRGGNVYGPGDDPKKGRVVPTFFEKAINNEPIHISVPKNKKISLLYVDDLSEMLLAALEKYAVCDPMNVVGSAEISLYELAKKIIALCHSHSSIQYEPVKVKSGIYRFSHKKLQHLSIAEQWSIEKGLLTMYKSLAH